MADDSPASNTEIRVFVVDDHPLIRQSIRTYLEGEPGFTVCGEAQNARETMDRVASSRPTLILQDLMLPEGDGFSLVRKLHAWNSRVPILVLSMYPDSLYAEKCLRLGASGFVMKRDAVDHLLPAIRAVVNGTIFVSDHVLQSLLSTLGTPEQKSRRLQNLSVRELEVIRLLGAGCSMAEISRKLGINRKTAATHRDHIKRKLGVSDNNEFVERAREWFPAELTGNCE
jgi:DNA-binding NarL/FixJ family response regulator